MNYTLCFKIPGENDFVFKSPAGLSVLEASRNAGLVLDAPCSGNGICKKCLVKISDGVKSQGDEWRLACQTMIEGDLTVQIPEKLPAKNNFKIIDFNDYGQSVFKSLEKEMISLGFTGDSGIESIYIQLKKPEIDDAAADSERLLQSIKKTLFGMAAGSAGRLKQPEAEISLYALKKLPEILRKNNFSCTCILSHAENIIRVMDVLPGPENPADKTIIPGLAIDIGTTTVAAVLIDLNKNEILASASRINPQIRFGADVISRIIESVKPGGLERLRKNLLTECLVPLIEELTAASKAKTGMENLQIYRAAIAANTTMTHLFTGVSPEFLRLEPYVPAFFRAKGFMAIDLELPIHPDADVLIAPSAGSYVGGDISAGIFASMIFNREANSLFIDLGTNGELVFGRKDFLITCACSAGPAFEGGDISCGMRAAAGAIDSVSIDRYSLEPEFTLIGNGSTRPLGICGSGLIDLAGELFAARLINPRGKFMPETIQDKSGRNRIQTDEYGMTRYILAFAEETENRKEIFITEGDLDNFIRAKGAVFSGIRTMLAILNFSTEDIDEIYIAGGIGSGINIEKAVRIGMLPNLPAKQYHYLGNTSLAGAWAMVQSGKAVNKVEEIANNMTYIELSSHPSYMEEFIAACFLPHTNSRLFGKNHEQ